MRLIDRPIQVRKDRKGRPAAFFWRGQRHRVAEILDWWREIGEWWNTGQLVTHTTYRVVDDAGGVYEIDFREPEGRWYLYRVYD